MDNFHKLAEGYWLVLHNHRSDRKFYMDMKKIIETINRETVTRLWDIEDKIKKNGYVHFYYDVGVKTCQLNLRVYNVLYLCISAPLYEARCSKNSDIGFLYVRHRSRHTSLYALLLNRHPCRFWLVCEQSSKNI